MSPALQLTLFTLGYLIYLFSDRTKLLRKLAVRLGDEEGSWKGSGSGAGREWLIYLQKAAGFLLMGVVPFLHLVYAEGGVGAAAEFSGLTLPQGQWTWTVLPLALVAGVTLLRSGKNIPLDFYPQVRRLEWGRRRVVLNALFWTLYLIGYEYVFRGYLLFPLVPEFGVYGVVALNASLYALAHIYKGPSEAFGAFFLGILFCVIALATSSILVPTVMHIVMAVGNDMSAVKMNREMRFIR